MPSDAGFNICTTHFNPALPADWQTNQVRRACSCSARAACATLFLASSAFVVPVRTTCRHTGYGNTRHLMTKHENSAGTQSCQQGRQPLQRQDRFQHHLYSSAATALQAVQLVSPILIASNVLANLHGLRCLETEGNASKLDQTFFSNCMYAVTHATGRSAVQVDCAKNVKLTESLDMYLLYSCIVLVTQLQ